MYEYSSYCVHIYSKGTFPACHAGCNVVHIRIIRTLYYLQPVTDSTGIQIVVLFFDIMSGSCMFLQGFCARFSYFSYFIAYFWLLLD